MKKLIGAVLFREFSAGRYIALVLSAVFILGAGFATVNYLSNDFGLWRHRDTARIWTLEKTSKYLLAHRYVPENFNGIMIGPSLSSNMDTRQIKGYKVYNLSMSGANISETGAAAWQYLQAPGSHKIMIICLNPYLTKNSGMKSFQIHRKEYFGSLFSLVPAVVWINKGLSWFGLGAHNFEQSEAGWNNFTDPKAQQDMAALARNIHSRLDRIKKGVEKPQPTPIDQQAVRELNDLLIMARQKQVRIVAYYYPVFGPTFEMMMYTGEWKNYRLAMEPLFRSGEILVDMNSKAFDDIRYNDQVYFDGAHMNQIGTTKVLTALNKALAEHPK